MKIAGRTVLGINILQCVQLQGTEIHELSADLRIETMRTTATMMNQTKSAQNARVERRRKRLECQSIRCCGLWRDGK